MSVYCIAGVCWCITPTTDFVTDKLQPYQCDSDRIDETLVITDDDLALEHTFAPRVSVGICEFTAILRKICHILLMRYDGLFLHAATIVYRNKAYAFTAPSGTGKTTHCLLWQRVLGEETVHFLNGDKLLIRMQNGRFIAYGNPWKGKEDYGENAAYELGGIFMLHRAEQNHVTDIAPQDALLALLKATVFPSDGMARVQLLDRLESLMATVDMCSLYINMQDEAVHTALSRINTV